MSLHKTKVTQNYQGAQSSQVGFTQPTPAATLQDPESQPDSVMSSA